MTSKKLNIIMLICLVLFASIFGITAALRQQELDRLDKEHDEQVQESMDKANQEIVDDATTTQKNENANTSGNLSSSNSTEITNGIVNFTDFVSMYTYAEKKLNQSSNIHSIGSGTGTVTGPTGLSGISFKNESVSLNFTRAQNTSQKYFDFHVQGKMLDGLFNLDYQTSTYSEGAISYLYFNQEGKGWQSISKDTLQDKFRWDTNQTFHVINSNSVKSTTLFYDKTTGIYTGTAELNVDLSSERSKYTYMAALNGEDPATYLTSKITVKVDKYGNFKSIRYQESFKINIHNDEYNTTLYATINADYTETFKVAGSGVVRITKPNI